VTNARHKAAIEKARQSALAARVSLERGAPLELASVDLKEAAYQLGLILGKSVSEDVLERIFENFCIGK
jgi:tRNA modification GTPase